MSDQLKLSDSSQFSSFVTLLAKSERMQSVTGIDEDELQQRLSGSWSADKALQEGMHNPPCSETALKFRTKQLKTRSIVIHGDRTTLVHG